MAYAIFPQVDTTRAAGFNWKLPLKVSPSFKTLVETPTNNRGELRVSLTPYPLWNFEMDLPYLFGDADISNDGFQQMIGFYGLMQGQAGAFLFDFPGNDSVANQSLGVGDGSTTVFPLVHSVGGMNELIQQFLNPKNFLLYSQQFTKSPWATHTSGGASAPTVTDNAVVAPDSTTTAATVAFPTTSSAQSSILWQPVQILGANRQMTFSIWLKVASGTGQIYISIGDQQTQGTLQLCNLTTSWQRFSTTYQFINDLQTPLYVAIQSNNLASITVDAWGGQMELGVSPNAYVTTTTNPQVYVNSVLQSPAGYAIDQYGNITFGSPPGAGLPITWSGSWHTLCRFLEDELQDLQMIRGNGSTSLWALKSLKFKSVLL